MKLITLAAGQGLRLKDSDGSDLPKPLINVLGKPIISWSLRSYSNLITQGLIKKSDLIFIINRSHEENYAFSKQLKELFGNSIKIYIIDEFTRGPAETALKGIIHFYNDISFDEGIIFNDCDHYFSASDLSKSINDKSNDSFDSTVCLSSNPDKDGSWSYAKIVNNQLIDIKEKDKELAAQSAPGLVACYKFRNKDVFISECQKMINESDFSGDSVKPEFYISKVIDRLLKNDKRVNYFFTKFAFPLGTPAQIKQFIGQFDEIKHYPEPKTYFFDIDGVLFEHDAGHHSKEERYSYPLVPIQQNIDLVKSLRHDGADIVLTTARPDRERVSLENCLKNNSIPYSKIIMGLSGGPRILVNDLKPSSPFSATAIAVNTERNSPITSDLKFNKTEKVLETFDGGSKANTLLMTDNDQKFVRKQVSKFVDANTGENVLKIQRDWYLLHSAYSDVIPKFYKDTDDGLSYSIDIEYIKGRKLSEISDHNDVNQSIDTVLANLKNMYDRFGVNVENDKDYWKFLLTKSVIPVLESFEKRLQLQDSIIIGGTSHSLLGYKFKKLLNSNNRLTDILETIDSGLHTKIHGDLTFENIMIREDGQPFLIDPLSSFMDMRQQPRGFGITSPMFDLAKLLQSSLGSYEKWSTHSHDFIKRNAVNDYELSFLAVETTSTNRIIKMYEHYNEYAHTIGLFLLSTILVRIINYVNLDNNLNKAILCYIYSLIILEEINNENFL
jgi:NDP-sugar pyrophosphorylase family protein/thiamine kinase-like enzyme